jgi:hypothetical protein
MSEFWKHRFLFLVTTPFSANDFCELIYSHWRKIITYEVQEFATQWMYKINHQRPKMALGGITPKQRLAMAV